MTAKARQRALEQARRVAAERGWRVYSVHPLSGPGRVYAATSDHHARWLDRTRSEQIRSARAWRRLRSVLGEPDHPDGLVDDTDPRLVFLVACAAHGVVDGPQVAKWINGLRRAGWLEAAPDGGWRLTAASCEPLRHLLRQLAAVWIDHPWDRGWEFEDGWPLAWEPVPNRFVCRRCNLRHPHWSERCIRCEDYYTKSGEASEGRMVDPFTPISSGAWPLATRPFSCVVWFGTLLAN